MRHPYWCGASSGDFTVFILEKAKKGLQKGGSVSHRAELYAFNSSPTCCFFSLKKRAFLHINKYSHNRPLPVSYPVVKMRPACLVLKTHRIGWVSALS